MSQVFSSWAGCRRRGGLTAINAADIFVGWVELIETHQTKPKRISPGHPLTLKIGGIGLELEPAAWGPSEFPTPPG